jgi:hypothetical protein
VRRDATGHFYVWIGNALRWEEAEKFAGQYAVKLDDGLVLKNWHLATITDAGENAFIYEAVLNRGGATAAFVGAIVRDRSLSNFKWVTGERFEYTNFAPGQPDVERENVLEIGGPWGAQWNNQDGPGSPAGVSQPFLLEHEPVSERVSVLWSPLGVAQ